MERVHIDEIRLHSHPKGAMACYDAEASWQEAKVIEFCGGQNRETALHEIAHLITKEGHSKIWAVALMALHRRYLSPDRCHRADRVLAMEYRSARPLYLERYGSAAPRIRIEKDRSKKKVRR